MAWVFGAIVVIYVLVAIIDRVTEAPIMHTRINRGTDRYRASVDYVNGDENRSIGDIQVGSGRMSDPMAKRLPLPPEPPANDPR